MPRTLESPTEYEARRKTYVDRVTALVEQLATLFRQGGLEVEVGSRLIEQPGGGADEVPTLAVKVVEGEEVRLKTFPIDEFDGFGRIELRGWETFNRVALIPQPDGGWTIMTDSGVPLRMPWTPEALVRLARDLVGVP